MKLTVRHTFYCGRPNPAKIALKFPAAEHVPASIPASAVHLSAGLVKNVAVSGKTVTVSVAPAPRHGITCMSIVLGRLKVTLDPTARLGNPGANGIYAVGVSDARAHYTAHFKVS